MQKKKCFNCCFFSCACGLRSTLLFEHPLGGPFLVSTSHKEERQADRQMRFFLQKSVFWILLACFLWVLLYPLVREIVAVFTAHTL